MRILIINEVCGTGSTGKICADIAREYEKKGYEAKIAYGRKKYVPAECQKYGIRIGNSLDVYAHVAKTLLFDQHGFGSIRATKKFLEWADDYNPDIIWLHNLHGYYINIELLFNWIKKRKVEVKWTLHDCWAFTGHCTYFLIANCDMWQTQCVNCPQKTRYPASRLFDNSYNNFQRKKEAFQGVSNLTLITPSQWLADLTRLSFLKNYPVTVKYNKINTEIFKPSPSHFRDQYGIGNKKMILCVASRWSKRKGIEDVIQLASLLDEDSIIVMVGVDEKQKKELPKNIIGISRTENAKQLAEIYTAADLLFNPTREDTYPTVNLEAEACGTKVVTYDAGGSRETLHDSRSVAIPVGDFKKVLDYMIEE